MRKRNLLRSGLLALLLIFQAGTVFGYERRIDTEDRAFIYTIDDRDGEDFSIDADEVAASLIAGTDVPGNQKEVGLRIVNNSTYTYRLQDISFHTVNLVDRNGIPQAAEGPISSDLEGSGSIYENLRGFDGERIPYKLNILRSICRPLRELFSPVPDTAEISLRQMLSVDQLVQQRGYDSYADYLLHWYRSHCQDCREAESLYQLEPVHIAEIFGTKSYGFDGQTEIRQPRSITLEELQQDPVYDRFFLYGRTSHRTEEGFDQPYEFLETDPELIKLGYWWLFAYGETFSFDTEAASLDRSRLSEIDPDGLSIWDFINHTGRAGEQLRKVRESVTLEPGQTLSFDHLGFSAQLPTAYDGRGLDFGFEIILHAIDRDVPEGDKPGGSNPGGNSPGGHRPGGGGGGGVTVTPVTPGTTIPSGTPPTDGPDPSGQEAPPLIEIASPSQPETPEAPPAPGKTDSPKAPVPKTGDTRMPELYGALFLLSLTGLVIYGITVRRKRTRERRD